MIIHCPQCTARYDYPDDRFGDRERKKFRCARCGSVFEISRTGGSSIADAPEEPSVVANSDQSAAPDASPVTEDLMEITLRKKERAMAEELPDDPPPPPRKRKRTSPGIARIDLSPSGSEDSTPKLPAGYRLSLAVINGPDAGRVFRIEQPHIVIGRSSADLELTDDEVSRNHASLEVRDAVILLEDLKSTNGTIHKGKSVEVPTPLHNHSEFKVGNTTLMLIVTKEG